MKKLLVLLLVSIALAGCKKEPVDYIKDGENLINCVSKLDQSSILYYQSKATKYVPDYMPVTIWYIEDVNGVMHSLNNYEIENYTCTKVESP